MRFMTIACLLHLPRVVPCISRHRMVRRRQAICRIPRSVGLLFAACATLLVMRAAPVAAQRKIVRAAPVAQMGLMPGADATKPEFAIALPPAETQEALEEFRKSLGKSAWDAAFRQMEKL